MSACACMGPTPTTCPCALKARGEKVPITETYISPQLFALLSEEEQETINSLKRKALGLYFGKTLACPSSS